VIGLVDRLPLKRGQARVLVYNHRGLLLRSVTSSDYPENVNNASLTHK
jgi:hypothetical protein